MNLIEAAVAPLKNDAVERAEQEAQKLIANVRKQLEVSNNDLNICAPYPDSLRCSTVEYFVMTGKRSLFNSITKYRVSSRRLSDPCFADMDTEKIVRFISDAKEDAAAQYDAFVAKLIKKIGQVTSANLIGNHVWSYSHLSVELIDGTKQVWKTQQIVNVSKLGKLFNQWPTRKVVR